MNFLKQISPQTRIQNRINQPTKTRFSPELETTFTAASGISTQASFSKLDQEWLKKLEKFVRLNLSSPELSVLIIAKNLHLSPRQLQRKMNELTGYSPNAYIREMRLQRAYTMLRTSRFATVKEVCYAVGFRDARYFSEQFIKRFGDKPSSLLN